MLLVQFFAGFPDTFAKAFAEFTRIGSWAALVIIVGAFKDADDWQGVRTWAKRTAMQDLAERLAKHTADEIDRRSHTVTATRDAKGRVTSLAVLVLSLLLLGVFSLFSTMASDHEWRMWLFVGVAISSATAIYFLIWLCALVTKYGRPNHDKDLATLGQLLIECEQRAATSPPTLPTSTVLSETPEKFRPIVEREFESAIDQFRPLRTFKREKQHIRYLDDLLQHASKSEERSRIDMLALCTEKSWDADHIRRYWKSNIEAVKAGVHISRIFILDDATRDRTFETARAQERAGVTAYTIERATLERLLAETHTVAVFGFTVFRGAGRAQVMLRDGLMDRVTAAAYDNEMLAASMHSVFREIRSKAQPVRKVRPARTADVARRRMRFHAGASENAGVRLEYSAAPDGTLTGMTICSRHVPVPLKPSQVLRFPDETTGLENEAWIVVHSHRHEREACERRGHSACMSCREGDLVFGVRSQRPSPQPTA